MKKLYRYAIMSEGIGGIALADSTALAKRMLEGKYGLCVEALSEKLRVWGWEDAVASNQIKDLGKRGSR